ncbi:conserved Plasmodium protein, unknown function [Plasmodium gallinaceum]|uniref:Uncharacterized protein n=1 Tax=Plasmodium gallinaceum TaxID=5849 RepID=A0A1J1GT98_PLAGA|nr:conserved Plasmodium protein, unknown function [Plasmodium gallinaceum]CRG94275.1 conserved Plasmodium protein, unknown function [Plasmodium gallinaceum]
MKNNKKENYGSISKNSIDSDEMNYNIHNNKKDIIKKYLSAVEEDMKEEIENFSDNILKSNLSYNQSEESSFIESEDNIILTDKDIRNSDDEKHLINKENINNSFSNRITNIISNSDNNSNCFSLNEDLNYLEDKKKFNDEKEEGQCEKEEKEEHYEEEEEKYEVMRTDKDIIYKINDNLEIDTLLTLDKSSELASINVEDDKFFMNQLQTIKKKNLIFEMEIKDINDWKTKYTYLISSFRKLDREINKIINNEHINLLTRRSIKQHKDFLDNEYKEWLFISQKTISEFKKNIGTHVSELNEKEYLILSKNIFENLKENNIEENNINSILYLFIIKQELTINDSLMKYLEDCYLSTNTDKFLQNTMKKINEMKNNIKNIGGNTGKWNDDDNNYFIKVYENNKTYGDEIIVKILKNGINKSEEEIYEHISWYHKYLTYNNLKIKYMNNINIININDQKKNNSKDTEKKFMIQKWKEKKKIKIKELEQTKKEEMKIKKKMREEIKKKKQMIQEHLNSKKEEMKKNNQEKRQKSILSEEMLQRINERNERILQKKVQSNLNFNEENNEKDKKIKQKYTHIQKNILKRIESSVETIKNIL